MITTYYNKHLTDDLNKLNEGAGKLEKLFWSPLVHIDSDVFGDQGNEIFSLIRFNDEIIE